MQGSWVKTGRGNCCEWADTGVYSKENGDSLNDFMKRKDMVVFTAEEVYPMVRRTGKAWC